MAARASYYIVRPGRTTVLPSGGLAQAPGRLVPLIAVDQLPDWINIVGVPRVLQPAEAVGMVAIGGYERWGRADVLEQAVQNGGQGEDDLEQTEDVTTVFEVCLRPENILANREELPAAAARGHTDGASHTAAAAAHDEGPTAHPVPTTELTAPEGSDHGDQTTPTKPADDKDRAGPTDTMDRANMTNMTDTAVDYALAAKIAADWQHWQATNASGGSSIRGRSRSRSSSTHGSLFASATNGAEPRSRGPRRKPGTPRLPCKYWCHRGACAYGDSCKFVHIMPTTPEGLQAVNLAGLPAWWTRAVTHNQPKTPKKKSSSNNTVGTMAVVTTVSNNHATITKEAKLAEKNWRGPRSPDKTTTTTTTATATAQGGRRNRAAASALRSPSPAPPSSTLESPSAHTAAVISGTHHSSLGTPAVSGGGGGDGGVADAITDADTNMQCVPESRSGDESPNLIDL
ncbi:zinc finger DNA-binding protein [Niveomyces insectorum RCEF 264]|uniref:Zinc finger DNA-binding protein n=1 Tax=Niveomyces insectorum RCEF 264 TaxID=1081102 RepID=A0A167PDQ7_9HYPO|nr:zinc finger DNA-binding protein [Niveomyces insectorum RCEF 264]